MVRLRVPLLVMALALFVGAAITQNAATATAAPSLSATHFDAAIPASFATARHVLITESCGNETCSYSERISSGPLSGYTMSGSDSFYVYALPDYGDCSQYDGYDCWEVESQTFTQPSSKSGYNAYVSTEADGEEECSSPSTFGWRQDMSAYHSVSNSPYFTVTAGWTKGPFLGGDDAHNQCYDGHYYGLKMGHWINVNNNWTWWQTAIQVVG